MRYAGTDEGEDEAPVTSETGRMGKYYGLAELMTVDLATVDP